MGTLASLMDISREALTADQAALDITARNVTNQTTAAYTREVVTWQSGDAVTINGTAYSEGVTTGATAVSQRDRVLEQRVQQQTQTQAQSGALETALQQVENIFGLTSTSTSASSTTLGSAMDSFFSSLSSLTSKSADIATRQGVLSAANSLVSAFNSASGQLAQVSSDLNRQVGTVVSQVNSLTKTIAVLNKQIASVSPNGDAGVLEDRRQQAITQLSQYVGLNQITTENNGITLTTSNGAVLVSGSQSFAMSTTLVAGNVHVLGGTGAQDVTQGLTGGQLGGVLYARDQEVPSFASALDNLAYAIGTQVNQQNAQGIDGYGNPGMALFNLPSTRSGAASGIGVATTDPLGIATALAGEGSAGNDNAISMADLSNVGIVGGQTASQFFASLLGQIGSVAAGATTDNSAQQATLAQLTTQRDSISGVSLDEEAANLTQYQRAYEAAAKVFSVVNTIMAGAINLGEQTTVS